MLKEELKDIFVETTKLVTKEDRFEYLIYSNNNRIREPELRYLLSNVLSNKKIFFGIEVPTQKKYCFKKNNLKNRFISARTDLTIFENNKPIINVELKEGQPTIDKIEKDFEKIFLEKVIGTSFFHVINGNISKKTIPSIFDCYQKAYQNIREKLKNNSNISDKWFVLFIFVVKEKKFYYKMFENLKSINEFEIV